MNENEQMRALADAIGEYALRKYVLPRLTRSVGFYRAAVTAPAENGKITVQQPFNAPQQVPYAGSAAALQAGDQCVVLVFGDPSNAIVLGDGTLSTLGSGGGGGGGDGDVVGPSSAADGGLAAFSGTTGKAIKKASGAGSGTQGIYLDANGIPRAVSYTVEKSVPANAVFTDTTYSDATQSAAGLMSAADKQKLDGVATGATANSPYTSAPRMDGTASAGSSANYARGDHVHPTDTTRAPLASPALTGTPTAPTAPAGTNTTQIATTAFVQAAVSAVAQVNIVLQDTVTAEKYMLQVKNGRLVLLGVAQDFDVSGAELVDQETGIVYNLAVANGRLLIEEAG